MKIIDAQQGSQEWLDIRTRHFTASEAPAMLGLSKYMSRSELLRQKATGIAPEVDGFKQALLDRGHSAEAVARPLAEIIIGDDLFPCTGAIEVDGLHLLASFDGLVMDESTCWENKLSNDAILTMLEGGELDGTYWPQVEQQLLVSGATRALFTACDGETITGSGWYESKPERRAQLLAGWKQFAIDLANYQHIEVIPAAVAEPQMALPAVTVMVDGSVAVRDNLNVFSDALHSYIERINKKPKTDQDFADLDASAKLLRETQTKLAAAKDNMLGQVSAVDTVRRAAEVLEELARTTAVELEKLVKAEKENRRNAIVSKGRADAHAHVASLNERLGKSYMPIMPEDFGGKVKGLKTITSIQNAVDTELARVKIEANSVADRIDANLKTLRELAADYAFLFADTPTIVMKATDDLTALVKSRIAEHKEAEEKKAAELREKIRAEEEAKAAKKIADDAAAAKAEADRIAAQSVATVAPVVDALVSVISNTPQPQPANTPVNERNAETPVIGHHETAPGRTMKLGDINAAIAPLSITADGLAQLGFVHVGNERAAKLYRESDFQAICDALIRHVQQAAGSMLLAA